MTVRLLSELPVDALSSLLAPLGLIVRRIDTGAAIEGSYWGEPEAGLVGNVLVVRGDTPVHSALHEACHYLCMDPARRQTLHTDAGGTDTEENAVCYLQSLLSDRLAGYSRGQLFSDMDAWGYHFILGSARAWFERDADDAIRWLRQRGLLTEDSALTLPVGTAQIAGCGAALPCDAIGGSEQPGTSSPASMDDSGP